MRARLGILALTLALGTTAFAQASGAGLEGVRHFDHIVVWVLENENYSNSWGTSSAAHYLNSLRSLGTFNDQYYATGHASLDNYVAMVSGQPDQPLTGSDCETVNLWACVQGQNILAFGRNLADQLDEKGVSWKGYMDGMPSACFHADYSPTALGPDPYQGNSTEEPAKDYADRHNPFLYFDDIVGNDARCKQHVVPFTQLASDVAANTLPAFSFVTPDTCNDGHDAPCADGRPGGLVSADAFLKAHAPSLIDYLRAHNGVLIVTFDENGFSDTSNPPGCCSGGLGGVLPGFGGRIGLVAVGAGIMAGKNVSTQYDHMSLLRTIEDSFGIAEHLNNASMASAMTDVL